MADLIALKAELDADPLGRGYSGMSDQQAADSLNVEDRTVDRTAVSGGEVFTAIEPADFLTVTDVAHRWVLEVMFGLDVVPLDSPNVRTILATVFSGKAGTIAALLALQTHVVSRADELELGNVRAGTVNQARRMP